MKGRNQITGITFGSGDNDTYSYDANSGHMTQFKFNVNGQSLVASIGWNPNGTVWSFSTTDPFNPANNGICQFGYDDMVRVTSANCAPTGGPAYWSQIFSFDPFGNISKSGSSAFQPTYSSTTNRITSLPGATISYDADGNLLNDGTYAYDWTAFGKASTVNGIAITYDALGRAVEQNNAGTYTQIVYDTSRAKIAMMNGQTLQKGFVRLPAGATAVYQASGLAWYRHSDMLGSSRLATTPTRTVAADRAYAPYGEAFNETGIQDRSFAGHDEDTIAGLYDAPARQYSPVQGRWLSPDPAGSSVFSSKTPQSLNRYAYVTNNPLGQVDDSGLGPCDPEFGYCPASCDPDLCPPLGGTGIPEPADGCTIVAVGPPSPNCVGINGPVGVPSPLDTVRDILHTIEYAIGRDRKCADFLSSKGIDAPTLADTILGAGTIGVRDASQMYSPSTAAQTNSLGLAIAINSSGAFFNSSANVDLVLNPATGKYEGQIQGGSSLAQAFILLHELGHLTGILGHDAGNNAAVAANDAKIKSNCAGALTEFSTDPNP